MTVETQLNLVFYNGDDVADTFPFTFPVFDADHLKVYFQDTTTKVLVLVNTSDYNVTGIGNENGGSVVLDDPATSDVRVLIARILPLQQDLDVLNQGGFYPENVEREFDIEEMQIQQLNEELQRSVSGALGEVWPDLPPAPIRAGHLLGFTDDSFAYPTIITDDLLASLLANILVAGFGISITVGGGHITITNTMPGGDSNAWLLEEGSGSGSGGGGAGGFDDAEFVRDTVFAALVGAGCTITQDDPGNTITITVAGGGGGVDAESVRDIIIAAIAAGTGIIITDDDAGDTTTIAADPEFIRDTIGAAIVGGAGITSTVDDAGNTITLSASPDILTVVSAATVTPTFAYDQVNVTAQAANLTIANPTGSAVNGHGILIRIKDNGTSRTLTWGAKFRVFNDSLPTATVINKTVYIGVVYNSADDKWDVLGVRSQA